MIIFSCKKEQSNELFDAGHGYYPLVQGKWIIYSADTIHYSPFGIDTVHWLVKEIVDTTFIDNVGNRYGWIKRYQIPADCTIWYNPPVIYSTMMNLTRVVRTEENVSFVLMEFPVKEEFKWNGNKYNTLPEQYYYYQNIHNKGKIGNIEFDSLVTVVKQDFSTLISRDFSEEIFTKGVGCVYKQDVHLTNIQAIKTGYFSEFAIVEWGDY
jgi:hypothetical protein